MFGKQLNGKSRSIIDRRCFLKTAVGTSAAVGLGLYENAFAGKVTAKRPNIVYVFADQLRRDVFAHRGDVKAITPNFDRLARESVSYDNAVSCMPVCAAHRACLFTGKYPTSNGMVINECCMNPNHQTIGYALHDAGYRMGYLGKWHLMDDKRGAIPKGPARLGFQHCDLWRAYNFNHQNYHGFYWDEDENGVSKRTAIEGCQTPQWTDMAIDFINDSAKKDEPFALFLSYSPPHDPWSQNNVPKKYYDMYKDVSFPHPENFSPDPDQYADRNKDPKVWKDKIVSGLEDWRRCYYAMVAMMDDELGRLSDALKKAGVEDDTIFVYTSDHGEMFGAQGRMYKLAFYEESARVPFYVRWPGKIKKDSRTDVCLNSPDIAPTLLGMAGVPVPGEMEGQDLSGAALGHKGPDPDYALLQGVGHTYLWRNGAEWRAVRDKRYTYARYLIDGKEHLYDNKEDPLQQKNLVEDKSSSAILERMRKALSDKMQSINDEFLLFTDYREKFMAAGDPYSIVAGAKGPFKGPYAPIPSTRANQSQLSGWAFKPIKILEFADMHLVTDNDKAVAYPRKVIQAMNEEGGDLALACGDMGTSGARSELELSKSILDELKMPYYPVIGNHDALYRGEQEETLFSEIFSLSQNNYHFVKNGVHFIGISHGCGKAYRKNSVRPKVMAWIKETLTKIPGNEPIVLFSHYPFGKGVRYQTPNSVEVLEMFKDKKLLAIISGHFHGNTERRENGILMTTTACCSGTRGNHDGTKAKGYRVFNIDKEMNVTTEFKEVK